MSPLNHHDDMNGDDFKEWFESLLPRLEHNAIIAMDNAVYGSLWQFIQKYFFNINTNYDKNYQMVNMFINDLNKF